MIGGSIFAEPKAPTPATTAITHYRNRQRNAFIVSKFLPSKTGYAHRVAQPLLVARRISTRDVGEMAREDCGSRLVGK